MNEFSVAVLVPCLNEEASIFRVVSELKENIPHATIIVGDNGSTDSTAAEATRAGAIVVSEIRRGKGLMMRRMFSEVDADCYLMLDGDLTYFVPDSIRLINEVQRNKVDMAIGVRREVDTSEGQAYRSGHKIGNTILSLMFSKLMGLELQDTLSGYRAMSRRFVKTFVGSSIGFEVETDLNAHAAILGCRISQIETPYVERPAGSSSKLRTYRDGFRILRRNFQLFQQVQPLLAFMGLALPWVIGAIAFLISFEYSYLYQDEVKVPSIVASSACGLVALHLITAGVIIKRISSQRSEQLRLAFLRF